jgi:hypothetical protein
MHEIEAKNQYKRYVKGRVEDLVNWSDKQSQQTFS